MTSPAKLKLFQQNLQNHYGAQRNRGHQQGPRQTLHLLYTSALRQHDRSAPYYKAGRRRAALPANGQRTRSNARTSRHHGST